MMLPRAAGNMLELAFLSFLVGLLKPLLELLTSPTQLSVGVALGLLRLMASRLVQVLLARSVRIVLTAL